MNRIAVQDQLDIHPSAVVDSAARLGPGVRVGAFCVIGPEVALGEGTIVHNNVTLFGKTSVGEHCTLYTGCVLGAPPQDLKYRGEDVRLVIGDHNVLREHVTAHPGTAGGGGVTRVGSHNLIMVGAHIGHDVTVGDHCIIANLVLLGGHAIIEDYANIGGDVGVHHFTTLGKHCMIAGTTRITSDVPPFLTVASTRSSRQEVRMVNGVGLKRRGFSDTQIRNLKAAYMRLFSRRARSSGVPIIKTVQELKRETTDENVLYLCDFLLRSFECGRHGRYLESLRTTSKLDPTSANQDPANQDPAKVIAPTKD